MITKEEIQCRLTGEREDVAWIGLSLESFRCQRKTPVPWKKTLVKLETHGNRSKVEVLQLPS